jgi:hypothetical protein
VDRARDLVLGDGKRRHDHDDVAQRPQEHASFDRRRADPPAEAVSRDELDPAHKTLEANVDDRLERSDQLVE